MVHFRTDIGATNSHAISNDENYAKGLDLDVLIVGAGFGGIYLLHRLREEMGLKCKVFEAGSELGGIWHWNCYPGARVDTKIPVYEYSFPQVWKDWTWTEKYPGWPELREYFAHVDKVLDVKKDVAFNTRVTNAQFDLPSHKWVIKTEDDRTVRAKYLMLATGFAAKRHFPDWKGIENFNGEMHHSSFWPEQDVDVKGKRVAVIGTGSTGVQIAQETSRRGAKVTVFQRTPNLALPMRQAKVSKEEQDANKELYPQIYKDRMKTFAGFAYDFRQVKTMDDTPEDREKFFEGLWERGGFEFWLATYKDMLYEMPANKEAYAFWAKKTRARITDPKKRDILAPSLENMPHAFGTKRPSLEQDYYEQMDKPDNEVVDLKTTNIAEITETGIRTEDGQLREFDLIALATGFDSVTGGMKNMGLKDINGIDLHEKWGEGTWSYLGMTCNDFPNMFFLYGAQGPTAFSNGPSCVEAQGEWIIDMMKKMEKDGVEYLNPTKEAEEDWRKNVTALSDETLFPGTSSWYMGANVPGKPREQLNYAGGIPKYKRECYETLDNFKGFTTSKGRVDEMMQGNEQQSFIQVQ